MQWFGFKRTIKLGIKSLWMHRLRSILTTLGIIFGVCSVIAMLAIGEGASRQTQEAIARLGSSNIIIETVKPPQKQTDSGSGNTVISYGLTYADAEAIRNCIPNVEVAVPIRQLDQQARYLNRKLPIKLIGTIPWYTEISPISVIRGRFLTSIDVEYRLNVCVIDEKTARDLFLFDDPMGQDIKIYGSYYRVMGISSSTIQNNHSNSFGGSNFETSDQAIGYVYIPVSTAKIRFTEFKASFDGGTSSRERVELQKITIKVQSMEQIIPIRNVLQALLENRHKEKDYNIIVPLELLKQAAQSKRIFNIVLGSIAAISLLVGGIGIMNIMLASVSERTREIGIRRALGAKKKDIIFQFLTETVLLTLIGGLVGIAVGALIPFLVTRFGNMPTVITTWSILLSFGISGATGITFGLYPAWRAANMDPIESLRHE
ncbi:MAG: ABC transporter permease [Planctomycetes bacterium]|nr:ABC transporter permease [Planctomycetota bacterium]